MIASFAANTFTTRDAGLSIAESQTYRQKRKNSGANTPPVTQKNKAKIKSLKKSKSKSNEDMEDARNSNLKNTRLSRFSISTPEDVLQNVRDRDGMKEWIAKYKLKNDLISKAMNCCHREYTEDSVT